MKSRINIFEENLMDSQKWEKRLRPKLEKLLRVKGLETVNWSLHPEMQRAGIDEILHSEKASIELKIRDFWTKKFHDILLETKTCSGPGWFYYSKADLVVYLWKNKTETNFENPGYFILLSDELKEWFKENKGRFKTKIAMSKRRETGATWETINKAVPISEFPAGSLVEFRPRLSSQEQTHLCRHFNEML